MSLFSGVTSSISGLFRSAWAKLPFGKGATADGAESVRSKGLKKEVGLKKDSGNDKNKGLKQEAHLKPEIGLGKAGSGKDKPSKIG